MKREKHTLTQNQREGLVKQVQNEWDLSWRNQYSRLDECEARLKLYNNQKRNKDRIGDTSLFTIFQTVFATLYADRLMSQWFPRTEGDEEVAENLNILAEYDYEEMRKDKTDFMWIWDTLFFNTGFLLVREWMRDPDKNIFVPVPEILDPLTFMYDPKADSVNGLDYFHRTGCRFCGWETEMTKEEMEEHEFFYKDALDFRAINIGGGAATEHSELSSLIESAREARNEAQGKEYNRLKDTESGLGVNKLYKVTQWFTNFEIKGKVKRVLAYLVNDRSKLVGLEVYDSKLVPIIDRQLYPTAHSFTGVSIPDLVEDKQRGRAVALNLAFDNMKRDLYPMSIYDSNKIIKRSDLKYDFGKFIPVPGADGNTIIPLRGNTPNLNLLNFIYSTLDAAAMRATATPEQRQGVQPSEDRTLGELKLISGGSDTRYSLSAKVFGWSETEFWNRWYQMYKYHFEDEVEEKILRLEGAFGAKWRKLGKDNIIAKIDPDVKIESKILVRAQQMEERNSLTVYFTLAFQDPTVNRRYGMRKLARLHGLEKDEIERLFPPTVDEVLAREENESLDENKGASVSPIDDDNVHLVEHKRANDTPAARAHIRTHIQNQLLKKLKPELFEEGGVARPGASPAGGTALNTLGQRPGEGIEAPPAAGRVAAAPGGQAQLPMGGAEQPRIE